MNGAWRAWFQSSATLGASFFNSARTKRLFSERLIVSDELLVLQWRSRIFVQKLILFNFYPFWHISYHNNVAQKWVIRDSLWGESCVPLAKMLPRRFLTRIGLYWQTMRPIAELSRARSARSGAPWITKFGNYPSEKILLWRSVRPPTRTQTSCKPMSNVTIDLAQLD